VNGMNFNDKNILNIYKHGSIVYNCKNINSDNDYVVVVNNESEYPEQLKINNNDYSFYKESEFKELIKKHEITALECLFLDPKFIIKETIKFDFELDLQQLRESISQKSSNSFVKAKKKLIVEKDYDPYVGKKSLFHSLRIILFGTQIAIYGKITNYEEANIYYNDIVNNDVVEWEYFKNIYQPIYNNLKTEFRKWAEKRKD